VRKFTCKKVSNTSSPVSSRGVPPVIRVQFIRCVGRENIHTISRSRSHMTFERESAGNPFDRISGARAFSYVPRFFLDPAEPCLADSPLAEQHRTYEGNSCIWGGYD